MCSMISCIFPKPFMYHICIIYICIYIYIYIYIQLLVTLRTTFLYCSPIPKFSAFHILKYFDKITKKLPDVIEPTQFQTKTWTNII